MSTGEFGNHSENKRYLKKKFNGILLKHALISRKLSFSKRPHPGLFIDILINLNEMAVKIKL